MRASAQPAVRASAQPNRGGLRSGCVFFFCSLREAANQLSNKLSHAQHLDEVTWTTKNWHGLQMQRLSVVLHTAVAWQTVNELACGDSGIVHGAKCIAVLNGVA